MKKSAIIKIIAVEQVCQASSNIRNKDLRKFLEIFTFYQNALHLTRIHCATFSQSESAKNESHEAY